MGAELLQKDYDERLSLEFEQRKNTVTSIREVTNIEEMAQRLEHMTVSSKGEAL